MRTCRPGCSRGASLIFGASVCGSMSRAFVTRGVLGLRRPGPVSARMNLAKGPLLG